MDRKHNFFDDLGANIDPAESARLAGIKQAEAEKLDYLIHKTFGQTEEGAELLAKWAETLIMTSTAEPGMDLIEVGIREGQKRFIKGIILTIKRVEGS